MTNKPKIQKKQWFEEWGYEINGDGRVVIHLPKVGGYDIIKFRKMSDPRVVALFEAWQCAMDQIQRDHGGYKP